MGNPPKNLNLEYKENKEFNSEDYYLFWDWRLFVSKVHLYNGMWYTNEGLNFKCTSILCVNFKDIKNKRVKIKGYDIEGEIWKCLPPFDLGIGWGKGYQRKYFVPYWTDINTLEFL